jgi:hypothetical protein
MAEYMSSLRRAERFLAVRLLALERQLPVDGGDSPLWAEYVETTSALAAVRGRLFPDAKPAPEVSGRRLTRTRSSGV